MQSLICNRKTSYGKCQKLHIRDFMATIRQLNNRSFHFVFRNRVDINIIDFVFRYPSVIFSFVLERHSSEQAAVILVPAMSKFVILFSSKVSFCNCICLFTVMASINLISLWLAPELPQRLMLVTFNILFHFLYLQQLPWYVPKNGDRCPNIGNVKMHFFFNFCEL